MNKRKSVEEWGQIIESARNSGLSDKDWCLENNVSINTFYYNVRRLRLHACAVPTSTVKHITPVQDVVPIKIVDDAKDRIYTKAETTAISINCNGSNYAPDIEQNILHLTECAEIVVPVRVTFRSPHYALGE